MKRKNDFFFLDKYSTLILIGFYFLLLLLRIKSGDFYLADSLEYLQTARYCIDGKYFTVMDEVVSKRLLVYPLFLALTITFNPYVIVFFQSILLLLSFKCFYKILSFYSLNRGLWFIVLVIGTPSIFIYSQLVMSEIVVLFLLTQMFYFFTVKFEWKNIKYIQIILTLLAFTKPVFYPFVFINLVLMGYHFYKVKKINYWVLFPVVFVILFIGLNQKRFGYPYFSSMENYNLVYYNLYYFKTVNESKEKATSWIEEINKETENLSIADKNQFLKKVSRTEIKEHFFSYSFYHALTGIRGIFDPGRFDLATFVEKEDGKQGFLEVLNGKKSFQFLFSKPQAFIVLILLFPIFLISIFKWIFFFKHFLKCKLDFFEVYFLALLGYYVLVTGPVNCSRYMMPFQLIIFTFALMALKKNKCSSKPKQ